MTTKTEIDNNLFNDKRMEYYISRFDGDLIINNNDEHPLDKWFEKLDNNELESEKGNYLNFFEIILEDLLGYTLDDIKYEENIGGEGRPVEFTLIKDSKDFVVVELKGTKHTDLTKKRGLPQTPVQQATNYASAKEETKWAIVSNYDEFRFFDPSARDKYISFKFRQLKDEKILKKFLLIFSKFSLIDNDLPTRLLNETKVIERQLEDEFYQLYSETRLMLIEELKYSSEEINSHEAIRLAQLILNRYIFLCFAEDLLLIDDQTTTKTISLHIENGTVDDYRIWDELNYLFKFANEGKETKNIPPFNGGLFKEDLRHLKIRDEVEDDEFFKECRREWTFDDKYDDILDDLGDYKDTLNPIYKNLLTISSFNFKSELDVNILGHIFENSISEIEELKDDNQNQQQDDGIYYTPEYITDFICRQTIIPYLSKTGNTKTVDELISEYNESNELEELDEKLKSIKILDPSCGSGSILNKSVDILLEIHKDLHETMYSIEQLDYHFDTLKHRKEIISDNIYGVDLNEESVEITKLSLFLKLSTSTGSENEFKLPDLQKNIKCGNSIIDDENIVGEKAFNWKNEFKEIFDDGGFDIVIGNPPYGAKLSANEKKYLNKRYIQGGSETAISFIKLSYDDLLKEGGKLSFIIPKSFTHASNYLPIRNHLFNDIETIIDCGKVWQNVKLEQIVFVTNKNNPLNYYNSGKREEEMLPLSFKVNKDYYSEFGLILNGVNNTDIGIARKIRSSNQFLNDISTNSRGIIQSKLQDEGKYKVIGGKQIQREGIVGIRGYLDENEQEKGWINDNSILVQGIVAHLTQPTDHIKITACIPNSNEYIIVDNINQITITPEIDQYFIWTILNSKLINWYCYAFIYAKSVRTMRFDNPVTSRIPLPNQNNELMDEIVMKAEKLSKCYPELKKIKNKFFNRLLHHFEGIKINRSLLNYETLDFKKFNKQLKNQKIKLTLKKEEEWEDYFNYSKENCLSILSEINQLTNDLNTLIYEIYGLNDEEIQIIENSFIE